MAFLNDGDGMYFQASILTEAFAPPVVQCCLYSEPRIVAEGLCGAHGENVFWAIDKALMALLRVLIFACGCKLCRHQKLRSKE
jgi:hypothetical protein